MLIALHHFFNYCHKPKPIFCMLPLKLPCVEVIQHQMSWQSSKLIARGKELLCVISAKSASTTCSCVTVAWPVEHCTCRCSCWGNRKGRHVTTSRQSLAEPLPSISCQKLTFCLKLKQQEDCFSFMTCKYVLLTSIVLQYKLLWGGCKVTYQPASLKCGHPNAYHKHKQMLLLHCKTCTWKFEGDERLRMRIGWRGSCMCMRTKREKIFKNPGRFKVQDQNWIQF